MLDEADRLLDLGFEAKLKAIIEKFDARSSNGTDAGADADVDAETGSHSKAHRRQTVLLSATLHPGLSVLAGLSLQDPVGVGFKAEVVDGQLQLAAEGGADGKQQEGQQGGKAAAAGGEIAFELPQQLKQKYVDVDAKMRLVYLIGKGVLLLLACGVHISVCWYWCAFLAEHAASDTDCPAIATMRALSGTLNSIMRKSGC